jgi:hypothetical protein
MTKHDLATLVFRSLALWLGAMGVSTLGQLPLGPQENPIDAATVFFAVAVLAVEAVVLWLLAPLLARAAFGRADGPVVFTLTPAGVPPLACFVVGLVVLALAVPQAASWVVLQLVGRPDDSLLDDAYFSFDRASAATGGEAIARLIVGGALIAISRRQGLWEPSAPEAPDESEA